MFLSSDLYVATLVLTYETRGCCVVETRTVCTVMALLYVIYRTEGLQIICLISNMNYSLGDCDVSVCVCRNMRLLLVNTLKTLLLLALYGRNSVID